MQLLGFYVRDLTLNTKIKKSVVYSHQIGTSVFYIFAPVKVAKATTEYQTALNSKHKKIFFHGPQIKKPHK